MEIYTKEEKEKALNIIETTISKCEKFLIKFQQGTSQHTLLVNRLNALNISQSLLLEKDVKYTKQELKKALPPIISIYNKCNKAILKHQKDTTHYNKLKPIIDAMKIASEYIESKIEEV